MEQQGSVQMDRGANRIPHRDETKMKSGEEKMATTVTILGSGTCVPSLTRSACSVLVQTGDEKILFDVGPGTMRRLLEAGVTIFEITRIFLSHFHPDHTGELVSFMFSNKYSGIKRRTRPLTLVAGRGLSSFWNGLRAVFGEWIVLPPELFELKPLNTTGPDTFWFDTIRVDSTPVVHRPESLAYRLTGIDGKSVVYSGDTDESDALVTLSKGADLLICEAAKPDELKKVGHLTPSLAGRIGRLAHVGKLVLTHFYPECDTADMIGQCRKTYSGPLMLAEDLMVVAIP
jgi:ribonuclease BN (tRNA processing enzyme)